MPHRLLATLRPMLPPLPVMQLLLQATRLRVQLAMPLPLLVTPLLPLAMPHRPLATLPRTPLLRLLLSNRS